MTGLHKGLNISSTFTSTSMKFWWDWLLAAETALCGRTWNHEAHRCLKSIARSSFLMTDKGICGRGFVKLAIRLASGMKSLSGRVFVIEIGFCTARFASLASFLALPFRPETLVSAEPSEGSETICLLLERRNPHFSPAIASHVTNLLVSLL